MIREFILRAQYPASGKPDMDWTEPCLELGSKFSVAGAMRSLQDIPVTRAWVRDEVLYIEGVVSVDVRSQPLKVQKSGKMIVQDTNPRFADFIFDHAEQWG